MKVFNRYEGNPILKPVKESQWEALMVYNCGAIYEGGKIHLIYRAQGEKGGISRFGYAVSKDGFSIDERSSIPIFEPDSKNEFETCGVEDPRVTRLDNRIYICYSAIGELDRMTSYRKVIQVGMASIEVDDFLDKRWHWSKRSYPLPRVDNKNACLLPEKIGDRYVMYHRIPPHIWISYSDDLEYWYDLSIVMSPQEDWEYFKIGLGAPPIKTEKGWLFLYHAVDSKLRYRIGLAFMDIEDPSKVIWRSKEPVLEPETEYEVEGVVPNVVYTCGTVLIDDTFFLYYGGADTVICVAITKLSSLLKAI